MLTMKGKVHTIGEMEFTEEMVEHKGIKVPAKLPSIVVEIETEDENDSNPMVRVPSGQVEAFLKLGLAPGDDVEISVTFPGAKAGKARTTRLGEGKETEHDTTFKENVTEFQTPKQAEAAKARAEAAEDEPATKTGKAK